jgi:hypothetical protein
MQAHKAANVCLLACLLFFSMLLTWHCCSLPLQNLGLPSDGLPGTTQILTYCFNLIVESLNWQKLRSTCCVALDISFDLNIAFCI